MSVHQKKNGTWFVQYRIPGERIPRREYFSGADGERKARIRDAEIKLIKARGQQPLDRGKVYLDTMAQAYIQERKMRGASNKWLYGFALLLNNYILPALTSKPVDAITYGDVLDFAERAWGKRTLATRQRYLGYLKALFRFGVEHGHSTNNPLAKWRKTKERRRDLRLTLEDLGKLLAHAPPHLAWAIEVEWELGTRPGPSELFSLRWDDVDWEACRVHVRGTKTHESNRLIPITPEFRDRLAAVRKTSECENIISYKGRPVKRMRKAVLGAAARAGLGYSVRLYDIRHLVASSMLAGGADLAAVSKILGHSNITTTQQHYYHLLQGEMARAIRSRPSIARATQPEE